MKLYVIRHCKSVGNTKDLVDDNSRPNGEDDQLSDEGKKQAEELALKLENYKIDLVIVSPFRRTRETVELYVKKHKVKVIVTDLVRERNAGVFAGKHKDSLKIYAQENGIADRVSWRPENGESILEVYERAREFLEYLKSNFKNKNILLCSHRNFLRCLDIVINEQNIMDYYSGSDVSHGDIREYNIK